MNTVLDLLKPRLLSASNALLRSNKKNSFARIAMFGFLGVVFWTGVFIIFYKVLNYFQSVQDFGTILAMKLLSMIIMIFL